MFVFFDVVVQDFCLISLCIFVCGFYSFVLVCVCAWWGLMTFFFGAEENCSFDQNIFIYWFDCFFVVVIIVHSFVFILFYACFSSFI